MDPSKEAERVPVSQLQPLVRNQVEAILQEMEERHAAEARQQSTLDSTISAMVAREFEKQRAVTQDDPAMAASAEQGVLAKIGKWEIAEIPVGGVALGLAASGLVDLLIGWIEGSTGKHLPIWLAKGAAAALVMKWGKKYMGTDAAKWTAGILTVDAIQSLYDLRGTFRNLGGKKIDGVDDAVGDDTPADEVELVGTDKMPEVKMPPELLGVGASPGEGAKRGMY
jgi:hypothetical protein